MADLEAAHRVVSGDRRQATYFSKKLVDQVGEIFSVYDELIFIMASGIVVRVIAPYIENKLTDPAVIVVDDVGRFVISLLSGHEGGQISWLIKLQISLKLMPLLLQEQRQGRIL